MYAKKNSTKKIAAVLLAVVLLVGCTIGGTLAWLSAQTNEVTNTFTVGKITITLAETTGESYKIVPGSTEDKDPKITVAQGSEKCYVYALVTNNVKLTDGTVGAQTNIDTTQWEAIKTSDNKTLYRYIGTNATNSIVNASSAAVECPVFTQVTYADTITEGTITQLDGKTIVIDAFAHQSDNTTQAVADAAAIAHFELNT